MTELPNIHEMDPDDWYDEVSGLADRFEDEITDVLDEETDPEEAREALYSILEPYMLDPDDGMSPDQLLVWVDEDDDEKKLCIGVPYGDYASVAYREDQGGWWYTSRELEDDDRTPTERHREIAEHAVGTTNWGDPDVAIQRVDAAKRDRRVATPYLKQLEEALETGDPSAGDLRELFVGFLRDCGPEEPDVDFHDVSPGEHRTRLELRDGDEVVGQILAVDPGKSLNRDGLVESFDVDDDVKILIATDHVRFTGRMAGNEPDDPWQLRMPSTKDEDLRTYHSEIALVVAALRGAKFTSD